MYTIKLNDGSSVTGLELEGNIFWSVNEITAGMFRGKLAPVEIVSDGKDDDDADWGDMAGYHKCMEVCYCRPEAGKYALALAEVPEERYENERRDANIEYIAMMTGVEL